MHKADQIELQLDQSQLPYSEYLGLIPQEAAQPDLTKKAHYTLPYLSFPLKPNIVLTFLSLGFFFFWVPLGGQCDWKGMVTREVTNTLVPYMPSIPLPLK